MSPRRIDPRGCNPWIWRFATGPESNSTLPRPCTCARGGSCLPRIGTPASAGTPAYGPDGGFLGLVTVGSDGSIRVERLFVSGDAGSTEPASFT